MHILSVLGSTGSIGTQTLDVVKAHPEELSVVCLAAKGGRKELLAHEARAFLPKLVAVEDEKAGHWLKDELKDVPAVRVAWGPEAIREAAAYPDADTVVAAMVGMAGLQSTVEAIRAGKRIALANKEVMVCAGELVNRLAQQYGVDILPVDSEHSAIFQCLSKVEPGDLKRIILTASGGAFRGKTADEVKNMRPEDALKHPNWVMGQKVTLDSASLVNKGLEMIEARWLFHTTHIDPIIQPTSIVHSMIELCDGTVLAQMGVPDMRLPIEVALLWPHRGRQVVKTLDFAALGQLAFEPIRAPFSRATDLAALCIEKGGTYPAVFSLADEAAVRRFVNGEIGFLDIYDELERALEKYAKADIEYTLDDLFELKRLLGV